MIYFSSVLANDAIDEEDEVSKSEEASSLMQLLFK